MIKLFVSFPSDQPQPVLAPLPRHERHCCLVVDSHSGVGEPEILTAYQKWGTACARYLSGDYAFVLWDGATQRLLAARSITGRCPLYMAQIPSGGLLCASDPFALMEQGLSVEWDARWMALWLIHGEDHWRFSPWQAISPLWPGHTLVYEHGRMQIHVSWSPPARLHIREMSFQEATTQFRSLFFQAVKTGLQGREVPTFDCSGGVDSSAVVATVAYLQQRGEINLEKIHAYHGYSAMYPEEDARRYLADLASLYPTIDAHLINIDELLSKPLAVPSVPYPSLRSVFMPAYPLEMEHVLKRQGSTAHFTGAYGDHLFAPTIRALWQQRMLRLPQTLWEWRGFQHPFLLLYRAFLAERAAHKNEQLPSWIAEEAGTLAAESLLQHKAGMQKWIADPFQRALVAEIIRDQHPLKIDLRMEEQRIELIYPYLNQELLEFLCQCPTPWLMAPAQVTRKALLREAMHGILPETIRKRADKGNATRIISAWSRQQCEALTSLASAQTPVPFVEPGALISAISRMSYGDCRDQRFMYHALAISAQERG